LGVDLAVDGFPVLCSAAVDVVEGEETFFLFPATLASSPVCAENIGAELCVSFSGMLPSPVAIVFCPLAPPSAVVLGVDLSVLDLALVSARLADVPAASGSSIEDECGGFFCFPASLADPRFHLISPRTPCSLS
jgi:hypothetical protein